MSHVVFGWVIIALSLLSAWFSLATGRVRFNSVWYVYRSQKPRIFWLAVFAPIAAGLIILIHGWG
jgi:hypothetical protein